MSNFRDAQNQAHPNKNKHLNVCFNNGIDTECKYSNMVTVFGIG